jgi:hypothetical protein
MLREITRIQQQDPNRRRRWFQDGYFDLFLWQTAAGTFDAMQLCYDTQRRERALVWSEAEGFFHDGVDTGDESPLADRSPVFVRDGAFQWSDVRTHFREAAGDLPAEVREFVLGKIDEYWREKHRARHAGRHKVRREAWQARGASAEDAEGGR